MMKILVCIKAVPDRDIHIRINNSGNWIDADDAGEYILNRFDEYALEEAVRIKEHFTDVTVEVLSLGPGHCRAVIRRALAKGADTGIHLLDLSPGYADTSSMTSAIADFCQNRAYDLILTGVISEDLMLGLTGPMLAARMGIPCAAAVIHQRINRHNGTVQVECELEGGWTSKMRLALPALLTIQSGINRPRYPSLTNVLRSRHQALNTLIPQHANRYGKMPRIIAMAEPATSGQATFLEGSLEEKATALLDLLIERGMVTL